MITASLELFKKMATTAHHRVALEEMLKTQPLAVQQAFHQNDGHALKSLFCNPAELADKTTVFQD